MKEAARRVTINCSLKGKNIGRIGESVKIMGKKDEKNQKCGKKRLRPWAKALIILAGIIAVLCVAVAILGTTLLNRLTRPGDLAGEQEALATLEPNPEPTDEAPEMTPTPTRSPEADVTMAPEATPLPISEFYEQTALTPEQEARMEQNNADSRYTSILLIGADRRATKGSYNSDTMMIATIDKVHNKLKLTTLMRDMLVDVPGVGYRKLNAAVAIGGMDLLYQTLEHNFRIKVEDYVMVDLHSFVEVIDAMGGITIKMTAAEISSANDNIAGLNKQYGVDYLWDGFIFAEEGPVLLTGKQALGYARIRHLDSEFVRTTRQFTVLNTIFAKFKKMGASKQYDLLYDMMPLVETSLTNAEILDAGLAALSMDVKGILYFRLPVDGLYQNGKWEKHFVFFCDLPAMSVKLHEFVFDSDETPKTAQVLNPNPSLPPRTPSLLVSPSPETGESGGLSGEAGLSGGSSLGGASPAPSSGWGLGG